MASFVQFIGKADLLEAYQNRDIDVWSICSGKEIISCGCGVDELTQFVDLLCRQPNSAIYTLRVYSAVSNPETITNKTEYNGSFKFTLDNVPAQVGGISRAGSMGTADIITQKINARIGAVVEKELDKLFSGGEKNDEAEESEGGLWGVLKPFVDTPDKLISTIGAIKQMFGGAAGVPISVPAMAAIGSPVKRAGAEPEPGTLIDSLPEPALIRLGAALDRLGKCDADIVAHLEQLADIAEKKPDTYKMALNFLK